MRSFGEFIKHNRSKKMTQKELAKLIGIGCPYLSKLENDIEPPPSDKVLMNLTNALALDKDDVFFMANRVPDDMSNFITSNRGIYNLVTKLSDIPIDISNNISYDILSLINGYEHLFREKDDIQILIDPSDFRIIDANSAAIEFYGYDKDELINKSIKDINPLPEDLIKLKVNQAAGREKANFYFTHKRSDNSYVDVQVHSHPFIIGKRTYLLSTISTVE